MPLLHAGAFPHWHPVQVWPPAQSASDSHVSPPHTTPSPHTTGRAEQMHLRQLVHGSEQASPGSPNCSPASTLPSPQWTSCCSYAPMTDVEIIKQKRGGDCEIYVYPDAQHGFYCDERGSYDEGAAKVAWRRAIAFLQKHVQK